MAKDIKQRPTAEAFAYHREHQEEHKLENPLRDMILGGQDGLVNALGIILGILAAGGNNHILVATVLAATFAESLSMGAVAYTSAMSQKDHYEAEKEKARKEIEKYPQMEREEVREIFEAKGFKDKVLDEIVDTITSDKKIWLNTMVTEELQLQSVDTRAVLKSSVIVTIATAIGHLIPLLPFFVTSGQQGLILSVIFSAITLFAVGVYQAVTLVGSWWKSGLKLVAIGLIAAFAGYLIATIFHVSAG
jgi:predicted membrane protein (TIGR00267 family)